MLCALLVLSFVFLSYVWSNSHQKNDLTKENNLIRVGYMVGNINFAPFFVTYIKDFFNSHNVTVEAIILNSGDEIKIALAAGQIDIALGGVTDFFIPISKGVPIKIIAPLASAQTYLFVRPDSKIKTFEDLLGKTIAARPGSVTGYNIRYVLEKENIDANKIEFVSIDKVYRPIALMDKKIVDAVPIGEDELAKFSESGAIPHEGWVAKGYANQLLPENVIAINENFKLSNSLLVEHFIDAIIDGHKFIKSNPDEAAQIVSTYIKKESGDAFVLSPENIITIWKNKKLEYVLWSDPAIFAEMSKIAVEIEQIESSLTVDQIFDLSFEQKLKEAQNEIYPAN